MIKIVLIISFVLESIYKFIKNYFNDCYDNGPLPSNVRDIYDERKYYHVKAYERASGKLSLTLSTIVAVITLFYYIFNVHAAVFNYFANLNIYLRYFILSLFSSLSFFPFLLIIDYYDEYKVKVKYGLRNCNKKKYFISIIKGRISSLLSSYVIIVAVTFLYTTFGNIALLIASLATIVYAIVVGTFSFFFINLFTKLTPLPDGELKSKLLAICEKNNVKVKKIVVRDTRRRPRGRANAFCGGLFKKTIAIDDKLLKQSPTDEVIAIFIHELGHLKGHHVYKMLPWAVFSYIYKYLAMVIILNFPSLFTAFGFTDVNFFFVFDLTLMIIWPLNELNTIIRNYQSRKNELEADALVATNGYGEELIDSIKRLNKEGFYEMNPNRWAYITKNPYPTTSQRIQAIREKENNILLEYFKKHIIKI